MSPPMNPASTRPVNFSAGPAILPPEVLEEASRGVVALPEVGLSILEISHRSKPFEAILADAHARLRRLLGVPDTHDIIFLQGGARGQFAQLPLNFLRAGEWAAYVDTGVWAKGAWEEAVRLGDARVVASGEASRYTELPDLSGLRLEGPLAYVHTTSNNTIFGTEWLDLPDFGARRHVSDMSSDFLSRPVDVSRFACIYAGAQKNAGPAGVTIVILDRAWMAEAREDIPLIWRYETQSKQDSMYNTPPCFAIYVVGLVAKWLEERGGLAWMERENEAKAALVYDAIARRPDVYRAVVPRPEHRSRMNLTFRLPTEDHEKRFVKEAEAAGLSGLKGHRSVGGLRASLYNAMPRSGVERLVDFMDRFSVG